nr:hypothetical protein [Bacillus thuringiensis]
MTQGYRKKEDEFEFNKDVGMYVYMVAGHMAIRKCCQGKKGGGANSTNIYCFDVRKDAKNHILNNSVFFIIIF